MLGNTFVKVTINGNDVNIFVETFKKIIDAAQNNLESQYSGAFKGGYQDKVGLQIQKALVAVSALQEKVEKAS